MVASGSPAPTFSNTAFTGCTPSTLPSLVTFSGAGVLSGTPAVRYGGQLHGLRGAVNGVTPNATQDFTLTVNPASTGTAPTISSADSTTATVGSAFSFPVVASGSPAPTFANTAFTGCTPSTLPSGVTFNDGVLSGTPPDGSVGSYTVCVQAANGVTPNATQTLTLTVAPHSSPSPPARRRLTQGGTVPMITPSYSAFVNSDTAASLTTAPTCSTTATSSSTPGPYPSTCSGAADPDYTFNYVAGTVTVNSAITGTAPTISSADSTTATEGIGVQLPGGRQR